MNWKKLIATGFGAGYLPVAPGSWGTLPGVVLWLILRPLPPLFYLLVVIVLSGLAIYVSTGSEKDFGKKDPEAIVIDEIVAFPLTMFLVPLTAGTLIVGFLLNRLMDIIKIWPCNALQRLPAGWGIVLDDLMAALYSCGLMHLVIHYRPNL